MPSRWLNGGSVKCANKVGVASCPRRQHRPATTAAPERSAAVFAPTTHVCRSSTLLLASSQGDSSFLVEALARVPGPLTKRYPLDLLVVQNGEAPEPPDTSDVNGYAFDGSTQFKYVDFVQTLTALGR